MPIRRNTQFRSKRRAGAIDPWPTPFRARLRAPVPGVTAGEGTTSLWNRQTALSPY